MENPLTEAQMAMEQLMAKYSLKDIVDYIDKRYIFGNVSFCEKLTVKKESYFRWRYSGRV